MRIERLGAEAWERMRALRLCALRDAPDAFGAKLDEDEARTPEAWQEHLSSPKAATFFVSLAGEDVGMAVGDAYRDREQTAGLFGMWIAPEARGTGAGDLLVQAVVAWARSEGHARVVLDVADDNVVAIRLYERNGFLPTGATSILSPDRPHIREHERALEL